MLIALEGIDGTGKSTLIRELGQKIKFLHTKEPGSLLVPSNHVLRELVLKDQGLSAFQRELLFAVDASSHAFEITNQCRHHKVIISDRGYWSHLAYLLGSFRTQLMDWEEYSLCKKIIERVCFKPQAVIYLQGDIALMKDRLKGEKDSIEKLGDEFFSYVLAGYDDLLKEAEIPTLVLNAKKSVTTNLNKAVDFINLLSTEAR